MGLGWFSAFFFTMVVILCAYILPTTLIGIVIISFEEATKRGALIREQLEKMEVVTKDAKAAMPEFFTEHRFERLEKVFQEMDCDGELSLDMAELAPCYEYVFQHTFDVELSTKQQEALFYIMDVDGDSSLGFAEFVVFILVVKNIEKKACEDPAFARAAFPAAFNGKGRRFTMSAVDIGDQVKELHSLLSGGGDGGGGGGDDEQQRLAANLLKEHEQDVAAAQAAQAAKWESDKQRSLAEV